MLFLFLIIFTTFIPFNLEADGGYCTFINKPIINETLASLVMDVHPELCDIIGSNDIAKPDDKKQPNITAILLTGPQGMGQTLAACVIAQKLGHSATFIKTKEINDDSTDKAIQELDMAFSHALNSKTKHTIILDDIDMLSGKHDGTPIMHLCHIIDTAKNKNITIIATTNKLSNVATPLQDIFKKSTIEFVTITDQAHEKILKYHLALQADNITIKTAKQETLGLSVKYIAAVIAKAKKIAHEKGIEKISDQDIISAAKEIKAATVSSADLSKDTLLNDIGDIVLEYCFKVPVPEQLKPYAWAAIAGTIIGTTLKWVRECIG
ncbi:MAG: AAA family ATPase [Candidatus Dependentiae bacterium]|nr:AAA family ATPase [Candidatus Dependentiae bacterium]